MKIRHTLTMPWYFLLPLAGMLLFIILYIIAATKYTGGSWMDPGDATFSFRYNYLCDLLDTRGVDGTINDARHWARASLGVLCVSLAYLWYHLPIIFPKKGLRLMLMQISGFIALILPLFLRPGTHDLTLRAAGVLGVVALMGLIRELLGNRYLAMGLLGLFCLFLFILNYAFYETGSYLEILPLLQKGTFVCFLALFVLLDLRIYSQKRRQLAG